MSIFRNRSHQEDRTCDISHVSITPNFSPDSPLTVIERDFGTFDQKTTVERESVLVNLDITSFRVGHQDTVLPLVWFVIVKIVLERTALRSVAKLSLFISA